MTAQEAMTPERARARMVGEIVAEGVHDPGVLAAMREVPRHLFVPPESVTNAYGDYPLSIGYGQTISQPFMVALMTQLSKPRSTDVALEIGTGCGYQTAVLAQLTARVYTIERLASLAKEAEQRLAALGYDNVETRTGDGYAGWPAAAPFDVILVTAAPTEVPQALLDQLGAGGRLVIPVGEPGAQDLVLIEKDQKGQIQRKRVIPVRFVEMKRGADDSTTRS